MAKGMFTQGVCVLLEREVTLDELAGVLGDFDVRGRREAAEQWAFSGRACCCRTSTR